MKLKLFLLCLVLVSPIFSSLPSASAANLSSCLDIRNIQVSVSGGNRVSFSANAYQVCQEFTPASGSLSVFSYSPIYSLKPLGISCSGPLLKSGRINPGLSGYYLGAINCNGTSTSYGTTRSNIEAWLPFDSVLVSFSHSSISTAQLLSQCTSLQNPRSSTSATSITLQVDVYSICSFLSREGERPVYQMSEEPSLFNLDSCSGPSLRSTSLSRELMGTATCTLRIGSSHSFLASSRTGSTSTTIELFYAWDFSRTNIAVSHSSIPSSGSSGGSTGGSSTPVVPQCTSAPKIPTLSMSWDDKGVTFTAKKSEGGDNPTSLLWNYVLFDTASAKWGDWVGWVSVGASETISKVFPPQAGKSRIAFGVYATNSCGSSEQARERSERTGVPLAVRVKDKIDELSPLGLFSYGDSPKSLASYARSANGMTLTYESLSPDICSVKAVEVSPLKPGDCKIKVTGASEFNITAAAPLNMSLVIQKGREVITVSDLSPIAIDEPRKITITSKGDPTFVVEKLTTYDYCEIINNTIIPRKVGPCGIKVTSTETDFYSSAGTAVVLQIVKGKNSISGSLPGALSSAEPFMITLAPSKAATFQLTSLTPQLCRVQNSFFTPVGSGDCEVKIKIDENDLYLPLEKTFKVLIAKVKQQLVIKERSFILTTKKGKAKIPITSTSGLLINIQSETPKVCESSSDGFVIPKASGECRLLIRQPGNALFDSTGTASITGYVVNDGFSITCIKGSSVKKVTGAKPKCPSGYTKK